MFGLIKNISMRLLASTVNACNHTKCVSLKNRQCMAQPIIINLHPNEYTQGMRRETFCS